MIDALVAQYTHRYAKVEEGHTLSQEATKGFEAVREACARTINAPESREIVFTRGCTEGLNLVARAFEDGGLHEGDEIVLFQAEHFSNIVPWQMACAKTGARIRVALLLPSGDLDMDAFKGLLSARTKVVSITHVSNVLGTVYPSGRSRPARST